MLQQQTMARTEPTRVLLSTLRVLLVRRPRSFGLVLAVAVAQAMRLAQEGRQEHQRWE